MIKIHVAAQGTEALVDRAWPAIFDSEMMSDQEIAEALIGYLLRIDSRLIREISDAASMVNRFWPNGDHDWKDLESNPIETRILE
jgi:hypothetical protein